MKRTIFLSLALAFPGVVAAQVPTAEQALQLRPMQTDVKFDIPAADTIKQCQVQPEESEGESAWVVRGPAGELLRRFVDSNADNKVDKWCYFKAGIEAYRDVDVDFNGKADQYRWLGTEGTRWGLDADEDGKIDSWKQISAEEVTSQALLAIKEKDLRRFAALLLQPAELKQLGLGPALEAKLAERIAQASSKFEGSIKQQKVIQPKSQWIDFGGLQPGSIPAGTDGSTRDVIVYENIVAMLETDGKATQLPIGTLVQTEHGWRLIDAPIVDGSETTPQFVFFEAPTPSVVATTQAPVGISEATQSLITELEKVDNALSKATAPADLAKLNGERADVLEKLAKNAPNENDRSMWNLQFADTVGAAAQSGAYPEGTERLAKLRAELEKSSQDQNLLAHVTFAHMSSEYSTSLQQEDAEFPKIQEKWLAQLEEFVTTYPQTDDTPEAILQLALGKEFAGADDEAKQWYAKIVTDFEKSPLAKKGAGAKRRLELVGQPFALTGRGIDGKPFDLNRLKGNVVIVHYWATWCEPCKVDMELLESAQKKFAKEKVQFVGVNLDNEPAAVTAYFQKNRPKWTHVYEQGGLDSRLAEEMGIFTLPVMVLIDSKGRVVNRQLTGAEIDAEVTKLLGKKAKE